MRDPGVRDARCLTLATKKKAILGISNPNYLANLIKGHQSMKMIITKIIKMLQFHQLAEIK